MEYKIKIIGLLIYVIVWIFSVVMCFVAENNSLWIIIMLIIGNVPLFWSREP